MIGNGGKERKRDQEKEERVVSELRVYNEIRSLFISLSLLFSFSMVKILKSN